MKNRIAFFFFLFCFFSIVSASVPDQSGWSPAPEGWHLTVEEALEKAKINKKFVLLVFSGSDWCGPCQALRKNIFETREFKNFARNNLELVLADSLKHTPQPETQKKYNRELSMELKNSFGVPSTQLLGPDGKQIEGIGGYKGFQEYMTELRMILRDARKLPPYDPSIRLNPLKVPEKKRYTSQQYQKNKQLLSHQEKNRIFKEADLDALKQLESKGFAIELIPRCYDFFNITNYKESLKIITRKSNITPEYRKHTAFLNYLGERGGLTHSILFSNALDMLYDGNAKDIFPMLEDAAQGNYSKPLSKYRKFLRSNRFPLSNRLSAENAERFFVMLKKNHFEFSDSKGTAYDFSATNELAAAAKKYGSNPSGRYPEDLLILLRFLNSSEANKNNAAAMLKPLRLKECINQEFPSGGYPLQLAVFAASGEFVAKLLELGADPNKRKNPTSTSILEEASRSEVIPDRIKKLELLVKYGAKDLDKALAASVGTYLIREQIPTAECLLKLGANPKKEVLLWRKKTTAYEVAGKRGIQRKQLLDLFDRWTSSTEPSEKTTKNIPPKSSMKEREIQRIVAQPNLPDNRPMTREERAEEVRRRMPKQTSRFGTPGIKRTPFAEAGNVPAKEFTPTPSGWKKGPRGWFLTLEEAQRKAKAENKLIYVLNTGSDWCGFCIALRKNVLDKSGFRRLMATKIVPVYLDSPRTSRLPNEQVEYQIRLKKKLRFSGGVPSAVLLSPDGKEIGRISGYRAENEYLSALKQYLR